MCDAALISYHYRMESSLVLLYSSILVSIITEWISDTDIACLDTAVCNSKLRSQFLLTLCKCQVYELDFSNRSDYSLNKSDWVKTRRLGVRRISVGAELHSSERIILSQLKRLIHVNCVTSSVFKDIVGCCPQIESLKLHGFADDEEFATLIKGVEGVKHLDLTACHALSGEVSELIAAQFPNLVSFRFPGYTYDFESGFDAASLVRSCQMLTDVDVEYNPQTVEALLQCTDLKSLSLNQREIEDEQFKDEDVVLIASRFPKLQALVLYNCRISETSLTGIFKMCHYLTCIDLPPVLVRDSFLFALGSECPLLASISVHCGELSDQGLQALITGCPGLRYVDISSCDSITNLGVFNLLTNLIGLTVLNVDKIRRISDVAIQNAFTVRPSLTELRVAYTSITVKSITSNIVNVLRLSMNIDSFTIVDSLKMQKTLHWQGVQFGSLDYDVILKQCPMLQMIQLSFHNAFVERNLETLVRECPHVTNFGFSFARIMVDLFVSILEKSDLKLRSLSIQIHQSVSDNVLSSLIAKQPNLRKLNLNAVKRYTNIFLVKLATSCPQLSSANFSCSDITSVGLDFLVRKCALLISLTVNDCALVDGDILKTVADVQRKMALLDISRCPLIRKDDVNKFQSQYEELVVALLYTR